MTTSPTHTATTALATGMLGLGLGGVAVLLGPVQGIPGSASPGPVVGYSWPAGVVVGLALAGAVLRHLPRAAVASCVAALTLSAGLAIALGRPLGGELLVLGAPFDGVVQFGVAVLLVLAAVGAAHGCRPPELAALLGGFAASAVLTTGGLRGYGLLVDEGGDPVGTGIVPPSPGAPVLVAALTALGAVALLVSTWRRDAQPLSGRAGWRPLAFAAVQCAAVGLLAIRTSSAALVVASVVAGLLGVAAAWWLCRDLPRAWAWCACAPGMLLPVAFGSLAPGWRLVGVALAAVGAVLLALRTPAHEGTSTRLAVLLVGAPLWWYTPSLAATGPIATRRYTDYPSPAVEVNALLAASTLQALLALVCTVLGAAAAVLHGRRARRDVTRDGGPAPDRRA